MSTFDLYASPTSIEMTGWGELLNGAGCRPHILIDFGVIAALTVLGAIPFGVDNRLELNTSLWKGIVR